jgi:phosphoadenosine phosphosulfate reductase
VRDGTFTRGAGLRLRARHIVITLVSLTSASAALNLRAFSETGFGYSGTTMYDPIALKAKSAELESATPQEILRFVFATYPNAAISTAFGPEGCALIDMAVRIKPEVPVFTIDTDYLFAETQALKDVLVARYRLNLKVIKPLLTIEEQARRHGENLYASNPDRCCAIRKVEPNQRAIAGLDAWIAGLRRDQTAVRAGTDILERYDHDDGKPYVKVNPLANWTRADTWNYLRDKGVPYNELLDRGYKSIGCSPCTQPVAAGEDERAGRWAGRGKTECGIHTFAQKKS